MKPPFTLSLNGKYVVSPSLLVPYLSLFPGVRYLIPITDFEVIDGKIHLDEECAEVRVYDQNSRRTLSPSDEDLSVFFNNTIKHHLNNPSLVNLILGYHYA